MKRTFSEEDGSDFGDDDIYKESNSPISSSCPSRKRRRGVVEKRRRDRINQSLIELKRLVPAAYEKQGSAKLEKAEILQMTVDHLKQLQQKASSCYTNVEHASMAIDYRTIGFRECSTELARYLSTVEGLDLQNPLRIRLLTHLESYCTQREITSRANLQQQQSHHHHHQLHQQQQQQQQHQWQNLNNIHHHQQNVYNSVGGSQYSTNSNSTSTMTMALFSDGEQHQHHHIHDNNSIQLTTLTSPSTAALLSSSKPYRPWGAELAY